MGPVIDDQPLSETSPIRAYTSDGRNYIGYCQDCPVAGSGTGMQCGGPCPAEGQTAAFRTPPPD